MLAHIPFTLRVDGLLLKFCEYTANTSKGMRCTPTYWIPTILCGDVPVFVVESGQRRTERGSPISVECTQLLQICRNTGAWIKGSPSCQLPMSSGCNGCDKVMWYSKGSHLNFADLEKRENPGSVHDWWSRMFASHTIRFPAPNSCQAAQWLMDGQKEHSH